MNGDVALEGKNLRRMEGSTALVGFRSGASFFGNRVLALEMEKLRVRVHVREAGRREASWSLGDEDDDLASIMELITCSTN